MLTTLVAGHRVPIPQQESHQNRCSSCQSLYDSRASYPHQPHYEKPSEEYPLLEQLDLRSDQEEEEAGGVLDELWDFYGGEDEGKGNDGHYAAPQFRSTGEGESGYPSAHGWNCKSRHERDDPKYSASKLADQPRSRQRGRDHHEENYGRPESGKSKISPYITLSPPMPQSHHPPHTPNSHQKYHACHEHPLHHPPLPTPHQPSFPQQLDTCHQRQPPLTRTLFLRAIRKGPSSTHSNSFSTDFWDLCQVDREVSNAARFVREYLRLWMDLEGMGRGACTRGEALFLSGQDTTPNEWTKSVDLTPIPHPSPTFQTGLNALWMRYINSSSRRYVGFWLPPGSAAKIPALPPSIITKEVIKLVDGIVGSVLEGLWDEICRRGGGVEDGVGEGGSVYSDIDGEGEWTCTRDRYVPGSSSKIPSRTHPTQPLHASLPSPRNPSEHHSQSTSYYSNPPTLLPARSSSLRPPPIWAQSQPSVWSR
ncbi:hypothetical protein DFS34DRAFT_635311 [Phlyctochytrium arcticum]|nr:hypothetical protein DFS34DRAFT_635311 [Phlyctochytrium arcticum]